MKVKEVQIKISENSRVTALSRNMYDPVSISFTADSWVAE